MFGTKLRMWMEAHIVRSRKKKERKKSEKGFDSTSSSPRSRATGRSPAFYQVHPVDSSTKSGDGIRGGAVSASSAASSAASAAAGSVNLSSPESAYSTGYSTDGTSPGASYPPEYYINIRTGTHYFQSSTSASTGTSGSTDTATTTASGSTATAANKNPTDRSRNNNNNNNNNNNDSSTSTRSSYVDENGNGRWQRSIGSPDPALSARRDGTLGAGSPSARSKARIEDATAARRARAPPHRRRTDSVSDSSSRATPRDPVLVSPTIQAGRERSRIRTNPWLPATPRASAPRLAESGSGSGSGSDATARAEFPKQESPSAGRSPINRDWRIASGLKVRPKASALSVGRRGSFGSSDDAGTGSGTSASTEDEENGNEKEESSASSVTRSGGSSSDDVTLNEMMGKFDESYVYEKETDILSDSDPTDCEDCIECPSDADAGREPELLDDEQLDYIDTGSFLGLGELERAAARLPDPGRCSYFPFAGELARRSSRFRESVTGRRSRDAGPDAAATVRRSIGARNGGRRRTSRSGRPTAEEATATSEKRRRRSSQRRPATREAGAAVVDGDEEAAANLNRVLLERMLLKNRGFNQASRSVGGTPICSRRRRRDADEKPASACRPPIPRVADLAEPDKRRSNSVSYVNENARIAAFASEIALIEADKEADRKYRELILEAEKILLSMRTSRDAADAADAADAVVPSPGRKLRHALANKRVELIKNTELNIELALSRSRISQPELRTGSIRDLEHPSPSRARSPLRRFVERTAPPLGPANLDSAPRPPLAAGWPGPPGREQAPATSSSSDSEERAESRTRPRPPLMTFRSIDMGPANEGSSSCPRSEPVKRKVYAGSATYGRIRKSLAEDESATLRSSDGDTATDPDTDDSRRSLKEKVAQLRRDRLEIAGPNGDSRIFQQRLAHLRRRMLMQTIQGLKRSLEDQSATLKQTCLVPVMTDRLPRG